MLYFLLIFLFLVIFSYFDFKKSFSLFISLKMLALGAMCIRYAPPALSIDFMCNVFFIFEAVRRGYFSSLRNRIRLFPLKVFFAWSISSITISTLLGIVPISSIFLGQVLVIVGNFIIPFLFWQVIKTKLDIRYFIQCCIIVGIAIASFGIYEFVVGANPFHNYLHSITTDELLLHKIYEPQDRIGLRRVTSLLPMTDSFICCGFVVVLVYAYNKYNKNKDEFRNFIAITFLMLGAVLLSNGRTSLAGTIIMVVPIFTSLNNSQTRKLIIASFVMLFAVSSFIMQYSDNITSMLSSSETSEIGGSSISMRLMQFAGCFELFLKSPIWGNGIGSTTYFASDEGGYRWIILGTESVWMKLLVNQGIIGIIAYVLLFWEINKRFKMFGDKFLLFVTGGYLAAHTISSLPGFQVSLFYCVVFCLYRLRIINRQEKLIEKMLCSSIDTTIKG